MKTSVVNLIRLSTSMLIACAALFNFGSARAATSTWTGSTDATWSTSGNWNTAFPTASDIALWDSTSTSNLSITLGAPASVLGLKVTSPSGAVTLSGSTLTIGTSGIDMSAATQNLTISSNLTIGAGNQVWNVASGRTLTLNTGTFTRTAGATLNLQLSGTVAASMTGLANDTSSGGGLIKWATVGTGTSTKYATLSSGKLVAYTLATSTNTWGFSDTTGTNNYTITAASATTYGGSSRNANTILYTGGADTLTIGNSVGNTSQLITNGLINAGTGTMNIVIGTGTTSAGVAAGSSKELVLVAANAAINISARVHDSSSGASLVTIVGPNTVTLSGTNDFTGGLTVNSGILSISTNLALGGAGGTAGTVTLNGGTLSTTAGITNTHAVTIGAAGGTINVNGAGQYFFNTANTLLGSGQLTVTGSGTLTTTGAGNLRLAQTNTYSGNAIMQSGGIIEYGIAGAVGAGATFTINNQGELAVQNGVALPNNITVNGGTNSVLSFENGTTGNFSGNITLNANATIGLRDWYNYATVRSGTISGVISGTGGLSVNSGSGTGGVLTLTNSNNFGGGTTITSAVVAANNSGAFGSGLITVGTGNSGQQIQLASGVNVSNALTINGGGVGSQGIVYGPAASGTATYSGAITINAPQFAGGDFATAGGVLNLTGPITSATTQVTFRTGTVVLSNTGSSYSSMLIQAGTVQLGANNAIPTGATVDTGVSGAATLDLAGFNQTLAGVTKSGGNNGIVTNSVTGTSTLTTTGSASFPGVLQDGGSGKVLALTVSGGALTLSGSNTNTGATNVTGGTLTVSGSGSINSSSGITINGSGAKLLQTSSVASTPNITVTQGTLDGTGTVGAVTVGDGTGGIVTNGNGTTTPLTLGSLTFNGVGTINVNTVGSAGLAVTGALNSGAVNTSGTTTINPNGSGGTWSAATPYDLITYGSLGGQGFGKFALGTLTGYGARFSGTLGNSGTSITLTLTGDTPKWTGLDSGNWVVGTTGTAGNWKLVGALTQTNYIDGDTVLFDDTASTTAVNISAANVTPASTTFSNDTKNYTVSSSGTFGIAGPGPLVKSGTGSVTLTTVNTYTGATTINNGTLQIGDGTTDGSINTTSNIVDNGVLVYNRVGSFTYGGVISGTGTVTKSGTGTQILTAVNTYSGGTTINAGTLQITQTGTAAIANVGTFNLNGGNFQINSSVNNFGYAPTISVTADSTFSSVGSGAINYTGALTGASNVLTVNSTSAAGRIYINGTVSGITQFNVTAGVMGFDLNVGNQGGLAPVNVSSGASLYIANASNTLFNNITLNGTGLGGVGALFQEGTASPTISGTITLASDSSIGGSGTSGGVTVNGLITGSGALTKIGTSKYTLSSSNNYIGSTTIAGGALLANNDGALSSGTVSISAVAGAQLQLGSGVNVSNPLTINGGGVVAQAALYVPSGDATYSGPISITGATQAGNHFGTAGGILTLTGPITSTVPVGVRIGTVVFTNTNSSYTAMTINQGTAKIGATNAIPVGVTATIAVSAAASLDLAGFNQTLAGLVQSGTASVATVTNSLTSSTSTLTTTGVSTYAGVIQDGAGALALNVTSGTLTLSSSNSYSGGTVINAGELQIRPSTTAQVGGLGTGTVTLNAGVLHFLMDQTGLPAATQTYANNVVLNGGTVFSEDGNTLLGTSTNTINVTASTTLQRRWGHVTGKALQLNGILQGSAALALSGNGGNVGEGASIWINNASNTYNGTITVNANTGTGGFAMVDGANSALQFANINLVGTRTGGATDAALLYGVQFATGVTAPVFGSLAGSGNINLADLSNSSVALKTGSNNASTTFSGILSGSGSLTKTGNGTMTLTGANTYTGGTIVTGGTLDLAHPNPTNAGIGAIRGTLTVNSGATVLTSVQNALGYNPGIETTAVNINGGTLNNTSTGDQGYGTTFNLTGGTMTSNGGVSSGTTASLFVLGKQSGGADAVNTFASGTTSTIAGRVQLAGENSNSNVTFTVADGAAATDLLVSAAITERNGPVGIIKAGAGIMTLSGSNSYTGLTDVQNGTLQFAQPDASVVTLTGGLNVATSGTAVLTAHTGGAANVKVLDLSALTISGTTPFIGDGGKDLGGLSSPAPVPEPGTIGLLAVGAIGGALLRRRNRKSGS